MRYYNELLTKDLHIQSRQKVINREKCKTSSFTKIGSTVAWNKPKTMQLCIKMENNKFKEDHKKCITYNISVFKKKITQFGQKGPFFEFFQKTPKRYFLLQKLGFVQKLANYN